MGLFNSNKKDGKPAPQSKSNSGKKETYNCAKFFSISRPWGYNPQEVDPAITKYNNLLAKQKGIIIKLKEENTSLKNEIQSLENELRDMQMQLSFATIPSVNSIQEEYILNEFDKAFQSEPRPNTVQQQIPTQTTTQPQNSYPDYKEEESQVFDFDALGYDKGDVQTSQNVEDNDLLNDVVSGEYDCDGDGSGDCVFDIPGLSDETNTIQQNIENKNSKSDDNPDDFFKDFKF